MSFGYSIGDFIAVLHLVNDVRKRFVNAPVQFRQVSADVKSLSNVLRDIDDIDPDDTLRDNNSGSGVSRVWKRLKWDHSEITAIQERVRERVTEFELFLSALSGMSIWLRKTWSIGPKRPWITSTSISTTKSRTRFWTGLVQQTTRHGSLISSTDGKRGTGEWLLNTSEFQPWVEKDRQILLCKGIPGAGKTMLASLMIDYLVQKFKAQADIVIAFIYCNFRQQHEQTAVDLLANVLKQLAQGYPSVPASIKDLNRQHQEKKTQPSFDQVAQHYAQPWRNSPSAEIPDILSLFEGKPALDILAAPDDVKLYLRGRRKDPQSSVLRDQGIQDKIVDAIETAVDGMSRKAIRNALKALPSGSDAYDSAYMDAMKRIEGNLLMRSDSQNSFCESCGDPNVTDRFGRTPLHAAASAGHVEAVEAFLASEIEDKYGRTPLMDALEREHHEVIQLRGERVDLTTEVKEPQGVRKVVHGQPVLLFE
ncbi:hypothetical protein BDV12DRAFT_201609 [Aspergillus spectabilis]